MTTQHLSGTTAIVTGACRGFGHGIATAVTRPTTSLIKLTAARTRRRSRS